MAADVVDSHATIDEKHRALALTICRALLMIVQALNKHYALGLRLTTRD